MNKRKKKLGPTGEPYAKWVGKRRRYWLGKYKVACGCENCSYNKNPLGLDFCHMDPRTKSRKSYDRPRGNGIGPFYQGAVNPEKNREKRKELMTEVRKCKILCKICHVIETFEKGEPEGGYKLSQERKKYKESLGTLELFF